VIRTVEDFRLVDPALAPVAERVLAGDRLDSDEGLLLATTPDLLGVGRMANLVRERLHGDRTCYNINRHLNPTNVCVASCKLCAFYVPWRQREDGWTYSVEQAVEIAARDVDESVSELHIVGGLHLMRADTRRIEETASFLRNENLKELHACHCTGFAALHALARETPLKETGVGTVLRYP